MRGQMAATAIPFKMLRRGGRNRMADARTRARAHERTQRAIGLGLCGEAAKDSIFGHENEKENGTTHEEVAPLSHLISRLPVSRRRRAGH